MDIEEKRMIEEIEIIQQIMYKQTIEEINNKIKPIGLRVNYVEVQQYLILEEINIDLIDLELWYNYFYKNEGLKYLIPQIKDHDDFKQYNYTIREFVLEELEECFNDPYYRIRIKDISTLSDQLLNDILKCIENMYFKIMEGI